LNPGNHAWLLCAEFLHVKPGKGAAFVRSKLKNLLNNTSREQTFRAGEMLNLADVNRREGQFTYAEGDQVTSLG
jgi:translation elongation factor P/translation initiation factor 5A